MALTLGRKVGQIIVIRPDDDPDKEIILSVSAVIGSDIRLSLDAPESTTIYREELLTSTS